MVNTDINPLKVIEETQKERLNILADLEAIKKTLTDMDKRVAKSELDLSDARKNSLRLRLDFQKALLQVANAKINSLAAMSELHILLEEVKKELVRLASAQDHLMLIENSKEG